MNLHTPLPKDSVLSSFDFSCEDPGRVINIQNEGYRAGMAGQMKKDEAFKRLTFDK
jgi:hypothetical protein